MLLRAAWIASLLCLVNMAVVHAGPALDDLKSRYQQKCEDIAAGAEWADDGLDTEVTGITRENVYDLKLTSDGKTGTVIYEAFGCRNLIGAPWCGSGGCSFFIIVDGITFQGFGGRPFSIAGHDRTFVLIPKRHYACEASDGGPGSACFALVVWDERLSTFSGRDNPLKVKASNSD
jgi:hypothetical protein